MSSFPSVRFSVNMVLMAKQVTLTTKKRRGPAPTGVGTLIGLRWHDPDLARIDQWAAKQPDKPIRSAAIRRLVELGLKKK